MIKALKSTWWVHLPGMLAIAAMLAVMALCQPWPSQVPVHFDSHFNPDRWGSPWEFAVFPVLATGIWLSGIWASTLWVRHEKGKKHFNLILPLVAAPLGVIAGIHLWFWSNLTLLSQTGHAPGGWWWAGACGAAMCFASIFLESRRKPAAYREDESDPSASPDQIVHPQRPSP